MHGVVAPTAWDEARCSVSESVLEDVHKHTANPKVLILGEVEIVWAVLKQPLCTVIL